MEDRIIKEDATVDQHFTKGHLTVDMSAAQRISTTSDQDYKLRAHKRTASEARYNIFLVCKHMPLLSLHKQYIRLT
jgi:hypothetical protein